MLLEGIVQLADLRFDTSTNGLKQVYTNPQAIYYKTDFLENVHFRNIYNF
jgi:hypothetical protein